MKIKSIFFKLLIFSILGIFANNAYAQIPKLPSAEDFGSLGTRDIDISDDGKSIIFITGEDKEANVRVVNLEDFSIRALGFQKHEKVRDAFWANDDYITVIATTTETSSNGVDFELPRAYVFSRKGLSAIEVMPKRDFGNINFLSAKVSSPYFAVFETSYYDNRAKLDIPKEKQQYNDRIVPILFLIDVRNGDGMEIETGSPETYEWGIGTGSKILARLDYNYYYNRYRIFYKSGKVWQQIYEHIPEKDEDYFDWSGLLDDKTGIFLLKKNGKTASYKIDLTSGKLEEFITDKEKEIDYIGIESNTGKPIIINYESLFPDYKWLDKEIEAIQVKLDATYPDDYVNIIDWSNDKKKYVFSLTSSSLPKRYYIYDIDKKKISGASNLLEGFKGFKFARKDLEVFDARDKQEVPVFVTFPNKAKLEKLPTIVLPHGGPQAHDDIYYDYLSQFLASRGYLVLQPQFRGSTGFGYKYAEAGKRQWGGIMQNDVTDSLKWAIEKGWADKDRACIIGASYGGYAALAGVTMTPDLYKCAVSGAGVSDLNLMLKSEIKSNGKNSRATDYWKEHIGFDKYTTEEIAKISPINLVDKIKVPVLLIHGDDDTVVLPEQSKKMEAAMKKAGKDVRYVVLKNEDHWLSRRETRTQFLTEIENFLKPILKPEE